jgi:rhodanese-related sulfurtransferase
MNLETRDHSRASASICVHSRFLFLPLVLLGVFFGGLAVHQSSAAEHTKDSLDKVKQAVKDKKAVLVDVREQKEWDMGHVEGAVLAPLTELSKAEKKKELSEKLAKQLPKDKVIYCHCARGRRALLAGDILKELGYDVRSLKPGYAELIKEGFPEAKKEDAKPKGKQ